ncbi:hypothetical protein GCM10018791_16020 [Streptomyces zaomyceticus]|nr:hypothetical protein GCM10018791_16020 [Streptomyces zaomyceticus]
MADLGDRVGLARGGEDADAGREERAEDEGEGGEDGAELHRECLLLVTVTVGDGGAGGAGGATRLAWNRWSPWNRREPWNPWNRWEPWNPWNRWFREMVP